MPSVCLERHNYKQMTPVNNVNIKCHNCAADTFQTAVTLFHRTATFCIDCLSQPLQCLHIYCIISKVDKNGPLKIAMFANLFAHSDNQSGLVMTIKTGSRSLSSLHSFVLFVHFKTETVKAGKTFNPTFRNYFLSRSIPSKMTECQYG